MNIYQNKRLSSSQDADFKQWFGDKVKRAFRNSAIAAITVNAPEVGAGWFDGGCRILARALRIIEPSGNIVTIVRYYDEEWNASHYGYEFSDGGVVDGNGFASDRNAWLESFIRLEDLKESDNYKVVDGEFDSEEVPTIPSLERALADSISKVLAGKRVRRTKVSSSNMLTTASADINDANVTGEYWIVDGDVSFADGEFGEIDHTGLAIQHATGLVLEALDIDSNGDSILIDDYDDEITDKFKEERLPEEGSVGEFVLRMLGEFGVEDAYGLYEASKGNGDPRNYALKHWGWKRYASKSVETQTLTSSDLDDIVGGLSSIMDESGIDENTRGDVMFDIWVVSSQVMYRSIPYSVISEGNVLSLSEYGIKYASGFSTPKTASASIVAYHGSSTDIQEFSYEFAGIGEDQYGSGFYFTTDEQEAAGYTRRRDQSDNPKPGGEDHPTVIEVRLDIRNPLDADAVGTIQKNQVKKLIMMSPILDEALTDWGDVDYEGREKVLSKAVDAYAHGSIKNTIVRALFPISNDFYRGHVKEFNEAVTKVLGYDGVVIRYDNPNGYFSMRTHYVAFRPDQIKIVGRRTVAQSDIFDLSVKTAAVDGSLLELDERSIQAIENTHGATWTKDGVEVEVERRQHPDQSGTTSVRSGVFYQPSGSYSKYPYSGKGGYGGLEQIKKKLLLKNPLFVKGATGGKAPQMAYDMIKGRGAFEKMNSDVSKNARPWRFGQINYKPESDVKAIRKLLVRYEGDVNVASDIERIFGNKIGNGLRYAILENIVANVVRNAGYDSIVGYSLRRDGTPFLSEVFNLNETTYPSPEKVAKTDIDFQIVIADDQSKEYPVAAVIVADGKVFEGRTHFEAIAKAKTLGYVEYGDDGSLVDRSGKTMNYDGSIDLFITNKGRLIDRWEASTMGVATASEDIPEDERDDIDSIVKKHGEHGIDARVTDSTRGNVIILDNLKVQKGSRKQGLGSAFMTDLCAYADRRGKDIELSLADAEPGETTSKNRLIRFYSRFGFVRNFGRTTDYKRCCQMYRKPQGVRAVASNCDGISLTASLPSGYSEIASDDGTFDVTDELGFSNDLMELEKESGLNILRDKNIDIVVVDLEGNPKAALYTGFLNNEFSFDVIVAKDSQGHGIGTHLIDRAVMEGKQWAREGFNFNVDVVNPTLIEPLKRRGFDVAEESGGHTIMELRRSAGSLGAKMTDKMDAGAFCRGYCPEFAIALHKATGWPIVVFNEIFKEDGEEYGALAHAACRAPDGRFADSRGLRDESTIIYNMLGSDAHPLEPGEYKIEETTAHDLSCDQEIVPEAFEQAKEFIRKNRKIWGIESKKSSANEAVLKFADSDLSNLNQWLEGSVVKTPVYHGSISEPFESFDPSKRGVGVGSPEEHAFFFASNPEEAEWYRQQAVQTSDEDSDGHVGAYYVRITNPYYPETSEFNQHDSDSPWAGGVAWVINTAKAAGHDGYVYEDKHATVYAVFDASQIKRAEPIKKAVASKKNQKVVLSRDNSEISDRDYDRIAEEYSEKQDSIATEIIDSFRSHKEKNRKWLVTWPLISASRLQKIWTDYTVYGVVRDVRGMQEITDHMIEGILRLRISNGICGRTAYNARQDFEEIGYEFTDEEWNHLIDGLETEKGEWYISDYGLPKLEALIIPLKTAKTAEEQLLVVDQMLNICHQRGDLAAMFVEGGSRTLNAVFLNGTEKSASYGKMPKSWFGSSKVVDDSGKPLVVYHGSTRPMMEYFHKEFIGTGTTRGLGPKPNYGGFFFSSDPENASYFADYHEVPKELSVDRVYAYGEGEEWYYSASDEDQEDEDGEFVETGDFILTGGPFKTQEQAEQAGQAHVKRYNAANKKNEDMFVRGYYLKIENPLDITGKEMFASNMSPPNLIPVAKDAGHDGVIIRGLIDGSFYADVYIVFDGSQVKHAGGVPKMASTVPATPEELAGTEFPVPEGGHSITPKRSFEWRNLMSEGPQSGHETLADLASYPDKWNFENALGKGWEQCDKIPNSLHLKSSIEAGNQIKIFRASDVGGGIWPGSYVTESMTYAKKHGKIQLEEGKWKLYSLMVWPDELVSLGDPHEFIYVPRDAATAHKRMINDTSKSAGSFEIVITGKLNLETGVDDAKASGHLDTQLFENCKGTKFDRDVVVKHRRRNKHRKAFAQEDRDLDGELIADLNAAYLAKWIPIESSVIREVSYSEPTGRLEFKMKNFREYSFHGVSKEEFDSFMVSQSKGKWFSDFVNKRKSIKKEKTVTASAKDKQVQNIVDSIMKIWDSPDIEYKVEQAKNGDGLNKIELGEHEDVKIFFVNGNYVKKEMMMDFVEGGHDAVYGKENGENEHFMPNNEVWIDAAVYISEIPYVIAHELFERNKMTNDGIKYEEAHTESNEVEHKLREEKLFEKVRKILSFPIISQSRPGLCGHACICMVLQYYNEDVTTDGIFDEASEADNAEGLPPETVKRIIEDHGAKAEIVEEMTIEDIKSRIDQGIPVIVEIQAWPSDEDKDMSKSNKDGHYAVAIGYTASHIVFSDPSSYQKTFLENDEMENRWRDIDSGKLHTKVGIVVTKNNSDEYYNEKTIKMGSEITITAKDSWGKAGAGVLYFCPDDQTIMLLRRSEEVQDPGAWGIPGGAVTGTEGFFDSEDLKNVEFDNETLQNSAHKETEEEIGHLPEGPKDNGSVTIAFGNFKYTTFRKDVTAEQKELINKNHTLNWESSELQWFPVNQLPNDTHPGVVQAVQKLFGG